MKKIMMMVAAIMMVATMAQAQNYGQALEKGVESFMRGWEFGDRAREHKLNQERMRLEMEILKQEKAHREEMMELQREMLKRSLDKMRKSDKAEECVTYCRSQYKPGYVGEYFIECVEKCINK